MVAAAVIGSAVVGGAVASSGAKKAAGAQVQAGQESNATQLAMYNQTRDDQEPWRKAGETALGQMNAGMVQGGDFNRDFTIADFNKDPGYDFRMQEGQRALDASASARGGVLGGAALKATQRYGQDYASNEYGNAYNRFNADRTNRFNRLSSLAGVGQTANNVIAGVGQNTAYNIGQTQQGMGNARASGYIGQSNAISGAANTMGNFAMYQGFMSPAASSAASAAPPAAASGGMGGGGWSSANSPWSTIG